MKNKALVLKVLVLSIAAASASNVWAAPTIYDAEQDIAINLNTENLDVLYTAVGDLDEEVGKNMVNIQTNTNKITANRTDINANTQKNVDQDINITTNRTDINTNTENLDVLYTAVGDLDEEVGKNMVNIQTNTNKITTNRTDINASTQKNVDQDINITANRTDINANTQKNVDQDINITTNRTDINTNTENLDVLYTAVGDLDEEVGKNMVNIQTNTNKITANRTDINANTQKNVDQDINITTNRTDINNINRINTAFDGRITNNERAINDLGYKVNELDDNLSAGIASAMALSSMPSQNIPGAHMITGGSGYYNGKGAVAIGLSGANNTGNVTYKIGGTYTEKGGSGFSVGGGWRWK